MEDDKKGLPVTGKPEDSLSSPAGRRKFLLNSAKVGVPAIVVLSARGAWGGPRDCMSDGPAMGSVLDAEQQGLSSVTCQQAGGSVVGAGFSPGGLLEMPGLLLELVDGTSHGRWPFDSGVPASWIDSKGHYKKPFGTPGWQPVTLTADATTLAELFSDQILGILGLYGDKAIYDALYNTQGALHQAIAAGLNAKIGLVRSGFPFPFNPGDLEALIVNFWNAPTVPDSLLSLVPSASGSSGQDFLEAYFNAMWTLN